MSSNTLPIWRTEKETTEFEHAVIKVKTCRRRRGQGQTHDFVVLDCPGWVNVIATTPEGQVVLIRQWRHGIQGVTLEIPGGMVDPGEDPMAAGARELLEETGYQAAELIPLGWVDPNPALFNNRCHTFWAQDAVWVHDARPEDTEDIEVLLTPRKDLPSLVASGRITHSLVVAALSLFWLRTGAMVL